ncbi:unnamed protein product [Polarella glacialis]|uniref:RecQ-mediated genome instability protein 1 n=1 Tax=Polarella glacialis TaxID=89957 RepID=A0A813G3X3_POLGL|nr:unnamed protein product [Polarella glacialis]
MDETILYVQGGTGSGKTVAMMSADSQFPVACCLPTTAAIMLAADYATALTGSKWRLLLVDLVIGGEKFKAIEVESVTDLGVHLPPGTKVLLHSTKEWPLRVQNGHVLLVQDAVEVLGGWVDKLAESWKASKDVEQNRLLWRQEGIKVKPEGEGAPRWVDFDPKKARFGGNIKKEVEQERAEWRAEKSVVAKTSAAKVAEERDEQGPRFKKEDLADEGNVPQVKTQVASSAFAQDPNAFGRSKGKGKGKGKGKEGGASDAWPRRGRGGEDYEEEKRAPQGGASLLAFIKPTKTGELPDEAVKLLLAPEKSAASQSASAGWDSGGWDASASGWGEGGGSGWGSSGGGGGGWSGSSGGGKHGGKGGGHAKGGGKGGGYGSSGGAGGASRKGGGGKGRW